MRLPVSEFHARLFLGIRIVVLFGFPAPAQHSPSTRPVLAQLSPSQLVSIAEAARLTGINRGQFNRAANAGQILDNGKTGRQRKIDWASVTQWAEAYRIRQTK